MFNFLKKRSWANFDAFEDRGTASGFPVTENSVLAIPAVFACIRVLSESVAALPLLVYKKDRNGNRNRATNFPLYDILHRNPNPMMTSFELRELMMAHLCLRGNAYCYVERDQGSVVAIWPLQPDRMAVEVKGRELIYAYQSDGREIKYRAEEILHIRGLSSDGIVGYSPLSLCRETWGSALATSSYAATFFQNDASPGGILSHPSQLSAQAHSNLKKSWDDGHRGKNKKHKVAVLEGGMKWESIGLSPEDSQMIESRKFDVIEIARIYRVPLSLINDLDRATYSNISEQNRSFLTHTLRPWLSRIEQALEKALLTEGERQEYSIEHLPDDLLRANTKERFESYQIAINAGILSINEIRKMENRNAIPEGDHAKTDA